MILSLRLLKTRALSPKYLFKTIGIDSTGCDLQVNCCIYHLINVNKFVFIRAHNLCMILGMEMYISCLTCRPTSESSSKELNLSCNLNQTWPGPDLTWARRQVRSMSSLKSLLMSPLEFPSIPPSKSPFKSPFKSPSKSPLNWRPL